MWSLWLINRGMELPPSPLDRKLGHLGHLTHTDFFLIPMLWRDQSIFLICIAKYNERYTFIAREEKETDIKWIHFNMSVKIGVQFDTEIYVKYTCRERVCLLDFSFCEKIPWHQHSLSVFLVKLGTQPNLWLHMCSFGGLEILMGSVQDGARVYVVLGLDPHVKLCKRLSL